jgi:2,3-bisphosphoglycerate-dependent phosphoglycerate mutase
MPRLILLRHGQSVWNEAGLFTGWTDVPLTLKGEAEALEAGMSLCKTGCLPDIVYTSFLRRSISTAHIALDQAGRHWIPVVRSWRLNERHYGALQGMNKATAVEQFGVEQVALWRRSWEVTPPAAGGQPESGAQARYLTVGVQEPNSESLKDVSQRLLPLWSDDIVPVLRSGKTVLIAAHGNSLRALMKLLEDISDRDIASVEVPTGVPIIYDIDEEMKATSCSTERTASLRTADVEMARGTLSCRLCDWQL